VSKWAVGEYVPFKNDPNSSVIVCTGHWKRPAVVNAALRVSEFWMEHWKWIIPTGIAAAAVIINALKK